MEWEVATSPIAYPDALTRMEARVAAIQAGTAEELVWLVEHPPLYTAGSSAKGGDLLRGHDDTTIVSPASNFPVYQTGRGGQYTYHGPGQRVVYMMLDLNRRGRDLRAYVQQLEQWIILTLAEFGIEGFIRDGRVGVWVATSAGEAKIAALGVRVQKWVTSHGIAINLNPDLAHYAGIVPCGIREFGVTSMRRMGSAATIAELDIALKATFASVFGER